MAQWKTSIAREPSKTKAELRQVLAEAVRNTQPDGRLEPKPTAKISRRKTNLALQRLSKV
jgi:hypothetical protein